MCIRDRYKQIGGEQITYNAIATTYHGDSGELSTTLLEQDIASYISFTEDGLETFNKLIGSLNQIILLIIAAASLLALIVLYNLVTINISERRREIATLKVLGLSLIHIFVPIAEKWQDLWKERNALPGRKQKV